MENDGGFWWCQWCGTQRVKVHTVEESAAYKLNIDKVVLAKRRELVLAAAGDTKHAKRKVAIRAEFEAFLLGCHQLVLEQALPTHVVDYLAWKETQGMGRTTVHLLLCPLVGTAQERGDAPMHCQCPTQLSASTLGNIVSCLKCELQAGGYVLPWGESKMPMGNPVDSELVNRYLTQAVVLQKKAGVAPRRPTPMYLKKLELLVSRLEMRLQTTTDLSLRLKILRDVVAWFAVIYWTGARDGQLAYTLTAHAHWEENGDSWMGDFYFRNVLF